MCVCYCIYTSIFRRASRIYIIYIFFLGPRKQWDTFEFARTSHCVTSVARFLLLLLWTSFTRCGHPADTRSRRRRRIVSLYYYIPFFSTHPRPLFFTPSRKIYIHTYIYNAPRVTSVYIYYILYLPLVSPRHFVARS